MRSLSSLDLSFSSIPSPLLCELRNIFSRKFSELEEKLICNDFYKEDKFIRGIILHEICNNLYQYKIYQEIENKTTMEDMENEIIAQHDKFLEETSSNRVEELEKLLKNINFIEDIDKLKISIFKLIKSLEELEESGLLIKENDFFYKIVLEKLKENDKEYVKLENFLELYDNMITHSWKLGLYIDEILETLSLEEQGMSDGERMRLNQFATIFGALEGEFKDKKYVTILFDEAETSLHPEWCRTLMYDYLKELKTNYPTKKFKLIFATRQS